MKWARILIFSMAMDADYTFELISIKTSAPQFKGLNKSFLASVVNLVNTLLNLQYFYNLVNDIRAYHGTF